MDHLQDVIYAAWARVRLRLEDEPALLAQRLARRRRPTLTRPPRAWCLAVRASDHRIPTHCNDPAEHQVTLTAQLLKHICKPVHLDAGGESIQTAATKLGTWPIGLLNARLKNTIRADYVKPAANEGNRCPILYADRPLDPCAKNFSPPDPAWLWTPNLLATHLPADFEQTLTRVPTFRAHVPRTLYDEFRHPEVDPVPPRSKSKKLPPPAPEQVDAAWYKWSRSGHFLGTDPSNWRKRPDDLGERPRRDLSKRERKPRHRPSMSKGSLHFRGFEWLCPACQKPCRTLYLPIRPFNLLERAQPRIAQCVDILRFPTNSHLATLSPSYPLMAFACARCHRVRFVTRAGPGDWNCLITYLTAGLLYGREVPKPAWFTYERKRRYTPLLNREHPRRDHVLRRLLEGWKMQQIAQEMKISPSAVWIHMRLIYAQYNVHSRQQLARKLNVTVHSSWTKRDEVRRHAQAGLIPAEIAARMGITLTAVRKQLYKLRKAGVNLPSHENAAVST